MKLKGQWNKSMFDVLFLLSLCLCFLFLHVILTSLFGVATTLWPLVIIQATATTTTTTTTHHDDDDGGSKERMVPVNNPSSIFVLVASYRDPLCQQTLQNVFERANNPSRIFVGVVDQSIGDNNVSPCVPFEWQYAPCDNDHVVCYRDHIRVLEQQHDKAEGPVHTRYMASKLYWNETFILIVDSHTQFLEQWDNVLINQYMTLPTYPSVLSHYLPPWEPSETPPNDIPKAMRASSFKPKTRVIIHCFNNEHGICLPSYILTKTIGGEPLLSPHVTGGFLFSTADLLLDVPFDPHLPFLFFGEEPLHSARLWTSGWDIYVPYRPVCFHYYVRPGTPRFYDVVPNNNNNKEEEEEEEEEREKRHKLTIKRVQYFMKLRNENNERIVPDHHHHDDTREWEIILDEDVYGLGNTRSINDYHNLVGYHYQKKDD